MKWHLEQNTFDYRDYSLDLADANGHGGRLRLTFSLDDGSAYVTLVLDDEDGTRFIDGEMSRKVSLVWANAIAQSVDGFTIPITEEAPR